VLVGPHGFQTVESRELSRISRSQEVVAGSGGQPTSLVALLHGETRWLEGPTPAVPAAVAASGGIISEQEEVELEALNEWMDAQGLPGGVLGYDFADPATGDQKAVFDLAWPNGIQEELS